MSEFLIEVISEAGETHDLLDQVAIELKSLGSDIAIDMGDLRDWSEVRIDRTLLNKIHFDQHDLDDLREGLSELIIGNGPEIDFLNFLKDQIYIEHRETRAEEQTKEQKIQYLASPEFVSDLAAMGYVVEVYLPPGVTSEDLEVHFLLEDWHKPPMGSAQQMCLDPAIDPHAFEQVLGVQQNNYDVISFLLRHGLVQVAGAEGVQFTDKTITYENLTREKLASYVDQTNALIADLYPNDPSVDALRILRRRYEFQLQLIDRIGADYFEDYNLYQRGSLFFHANETPQAIHIYGVEETAKKTSYSLELDRYNLLDNFLVAVYDLTCHNQLIGDESLTYDIFKKKLLQGLAPESQKAYGKILDLVEQDDGLLFDSLTRDSAEGLHSAVTQRLTKRLYQSVVDYSYTVINDGSMSTTRETSVFYNAKKITELTGEKFVCIQLGAAHLDTGLSAAPRGTMQPLYKNKDNKTAYIHIRPASMKD